MPLTLKELSNRHATCKSNRCGQWKDSACGLSHRINSDSACPIGYFTTSQFNTSSKVAPQVSKLEWTDVLLDFSRSLQRWVASGLKTVLPQDHEIRFSKCQQNTCGKYSNFVCTGCGCIAYAKTKLETEKCPIGLW